MVATTLKFYAAKSFCKHICWLCNGGNKFYLDLPFVLFLSDEVLISFELFSFFVEHGILGNLDRTLIIAMKFGR
jgi:hypothetical protein